MTVSPRAEPTTHGPSCAARLRLRLLVQAGEPDVPDAILLNDIADEIRRHCGHRALKCHRLARGWTVEAAVAAFHAMCRVDGLGSRGLTDRSWLGWEAGANKPNDDYRDLLCRLFQTNPVCLGFAQDYTPMIGQKTATLSIQPIPAPQHPSDTGGTEAPSNASDSDCGPISMSALDRARMLREGVDKVVGGGAMSEAGLEDWEQTTLRLGAATRYRSSGPLLDELITDFAELQGKLALRQPISALRRLTLVAAQMAGLMSLTLLKLSQSAESRHWARTARIAADEAGDPSVRSWVRAQEAYCSYYDGWFSRAAHIARQAQDVAAGKPCVGVVLAAALEARAEGALGHREEAYAALRRAEAAFAELDAETVIRSAFGYDEAQLRFHEGNVLTHLHDTDAAWRAHQRALELYPANDYLDRALIWLDRASCLAHDGDVPAAMAHAVDALVDLTDRQRCGLVTVRGQQIFDGLSESQRALPAAPEFRDVLMLPATTRMETDDRRTAG